MNAGHAQGLAVFGNGVLQQVLFLLIQGDELGLQKASHGHAVGFQGSDEINQALARVEQSDKLLVAGGFVQFLFHLQGHAREVFEVAQVIHGHALHEVQGEAHAFLRGHMLVAHAKELAHKVGGRAADRDHHLGGEDDAYGDGDVGDAVVGLVKQRGLDDNKQAVVFHFQARAFVGVQGVGQKVPGYACGFGHLAHFRFRGHKQVYPAIPADGILGH